MMRKVRIELATSHKTQKHLKSLLLTCFLSFPILPSLQVCTQQVRTTPQQPQPPTSSPQSVKMLAAKIFVTILLGVIPIHAAPGPLPTDGPVAKPEPYVVILKLNLLRFSHNLSSRTNSGHTEPKLSLEH